MAPNLICRRSTRPAVDRFGWGQPGAPIPFDGVGFHPYVLRDSFNPQAEIPARYRQYMAQVRNVIGRFDAPEKPLFLSEIGWQNPDDRQAACMEAGLTAALDDPAVALCFWYGMQDDDGEKYGLYRQDGLSVGHRKPIYDRFVALATNPRSVPAAQVRAKAIGGALCRRVGQRARRHGVGARTRLHQGLADAEHRWHDLG